MTVWNTVSDGLTNGRLVFGEDAQMLVMMVMMVPPPII
jgi:hypothetical protein